MSQYFLTLQEPIHSIRCHPTKDSLEKAAEKSQKQEDDQLASEKDSQSVVRGAGGSDLAEEAVKSKEGEAKSASPMPQGGQGEALAVELDTLSDEAMNELVSSMIRQASQDDPDIDFLGLTDEDDAYDSAGNYHDVTTSRDSPADAQSADALPDEGTHSSDDEEEDMQEPQIHDFEEL